MKKRKVICVKLLGSFCYTMPDESEEPPFGKDPAGQERKEYCMISGKIGKKALSFLQYLVINHTRNITAEELIDTFWTEKHSSDPANALRNMIFKIRSPAPTSTWATGPE